ncbi:MAG: carbohydrate deacetylase [Anaerolineales bacterium]|jgi:predicted glycoside hydrolase/deacetylase ChbG (UPF0249 family)
MAKQLIVNADDYGRTEGVSRGIRRAHLEGIVSTTTVMMNLPGAAEAVRLAKEESPQLGLGVHLNVTYGEPLSPKVKRSSMTDSLGRLPPKEFFFQHPGRIVPDDVKREWRTQIETFLACGAVLDHIDSHHHVALASGQLWGLYLECAGEYGCGVRLPNAVDVPDDELRDALPQRCIDFARREALRSLDDADIHHPDHFFASFFAAGVSLEHFIRILRSLPDGVNELMCHPGFVDSELRATSGYAKPREREFQILTDPAVRQAIQENRITLSSFRRARA